MQKKSGRSVSSSGSLACASSTGRHFSMASHQLHRSLFSECCTPNTELVPFATPKVSVGLSSQLPIKRQSLTDDGLLMQRALLSRPVGSFETHSRNGKSAVLYVIAAVFILATIALYHSSL